MQVVGIAMLSRFRCLEDRKPQAVSDFTHDASSLLAVSAGKQHGGLATLCQKNPGQAQSGSREDCLQ
jgi:hypothetical protein